MTTLEHVRNELARIYEELRIAGERGHYDEAKVLAVGVHIQQLIHTVREALEEDCAA